MESTLLSKINYIYKLKNYLNIYPQNFLKEIISYHSDKMPKDENLIIAIYFFDKEIDITHNPEWNNIFEFSQKMHIDNDKLDVKNDSINQEFDIPKKISRNEFVVYFLDINKLIIISHIKAIKTNKIQICYDNNGCIYIKYIQVNNIYLGIGICQLLIQKLIELTNAISYSLDNVGGIAGYFCYLKAFKHEKFNIYDENKNLIENISAKNFNEDYTRLYFTKEIKPNE